MEQSSDPIYLEWEALVAVLDGVLSRILFVTERPSIASGLKLLEKCLSVKTEDPLVYSVLLSCISSLFVFLSMSVGNEGQLLLQVLKKIFDALIFPMPSEDPIRAAAVKNLKRHAASAIVKIALKYPLLLLSVFDQIDNYIKTLCSSDSTLTGMEKCLLKVALLIISNHFCEFERQQMFVGDIVRPSCLVWEGLGKNKLKTLSGQI